MEAYFKSPEFLSHYEEVSKQLVIDLQTALDDETFSKLLTEFLQALFQLIVV